MSQPARRIPTPLLEVPIPFPSSVSPDVARARARHLAWAEGFGLWPDDRTRVTYEAADFPLFVGRTYPWATGTDLDLATDLIGWSWLWDDSLDKPGPRRASPAHISVQLDQYRHVLMTRSPDFAAAPLVTAWRQLLDRLHERTSAHWHTRHQRHWEATYSSYLQEAENNMRGIIPCFADYRQIRRNAGGMDICLDWVEAVGRYELPPTVHANPTLRTLRLHEQDVVAMTNDLFSASNEWADGNTDNIVHVLANQERCTWAEAAHRTRGLITAAIDEFRKAERNLYTCLAYTTLPPTDQHNTRRFINAMKTWMRGSLDWHLSSPRYRQRQTRV